MVTGPIASNTHRRISFLPHRFRAVALMAGATVAGLAQTNNPSDLTQMNLEDLMNVKVTSVSKREQKLSRTAAAIFVISQEDIRRSGATNIPDLLRMAPGVNVERINANAWAISIRGFNQHYSNKVLVLIDGRSVYSPIFSGVSWDQLDMPLEDIERIEVIRGPGGTIWGANAVNGVISILTKSSKDTQGGMLTAAGGSQLRGLGQIRYGGKAGRDGTFRAFAKIFDVGNSASADGSPADDSWQRGRAGFRFDWEHANRDAVVLEGDLFANEENQTSRNGNIPTPFDILSHTELDAAGGSMLARWTHTLAGGSQTSVQAYYDTYRRTDFGIPATLRLFDLDFQHHVTAGDRHDIVWGLSYRVGRSSFAPGYAIRFSSYSRTDNLFSGFLQDEIRLSDAVSLTVGWKLEHNAYTGLENEPSARIAWNPSSGRHTVWATASRAIRQPAFADASVDSPLSIIPAGPDAVVVLRLFGNPHLKAETVRDFEIGYRSELSKRLSVDTATFISFYRDLLTTEPLPTVVIPGSPLQLFMPSKFDNNARATNYGGEASLNWKATARVRISPGYSYLHANLRLEPSSNGNITTSLAKDFPQHTFQIHSLMNLSSKWDFDQALYYTPRLPNSSIPGHARLDLRLSRRIGEVAEISVVGQNLLRPRSFEYGDANALVGTQTVRSIYGKITWRF
ncbi:MAG: TonB-dependent receptor [Bryobacteraceae bacterium]